MNRSLMIAAALAACSIGTTAASAHGGWVVGAPYYYAPYPRVMPRYVLPPVYTYRYYAPYRAYPAPVFVVPRAYPAPVYEPPRYEPPVVQRRYAENEPVRPQPPASSRPASPTPLLERYTLSAKELFGFDEANIRGSNAKLDRIAEAMKRHPDIDNVRITGYTDRIGSDAYNLKLSQRRAEAVKAYLVARGVEARRLQALGKGKADPAVECHDKDRAALIRCLEPNRRVEVEQIVIERSR